ncbi:MAG TPA: methyltransferase domain-containing protein [Vicinamibacterales bacterium]|jgi:SAM-dependent methyltransferase|nr:methyltransferase domain-containing protein [Vicinamibacterales bacterium]
MISARLLDLVQCPDCGHMLTRDTPVRVTCTGCGRAFAADRGYLDLQPASAFQEQTKYLDHALHADARHESIAPPVLGSKIRNDMLRRFLQPAPGDRIVDLGCGSGRAIVWNAGCGADMLGVDISPFFAAEAIERADLILGDLRKLPLRGDAFTKAWSLDVLEHLSPQALRDMLTEANRVLAPGGALFVYTHVRKNGWPAAGLRLVNRLARLIERTGLLDLRQERLRKSDHLNPIADHDELARVTRACGFEIERITYYSPIAGAFVENILVRMAERFLARRAARHTDASAAPDAAAPVRAARAAAQARVRRGGLLYRSLVLVTAIMKIDIWLFGRIPSGPFFALLRKTPAAASAAPAVSPAARAEAAV